MENPGKTVKAVTLEVIAVALVFATGVALQHPGRALAQQRSLAEGDRSNLPAAVAGRPVSDYGAVTTEKGFREQIFPQKPSGNASVGSGADDGEECESCTRVGDGTFTGTTADNTGSTGDDTLCAFTDDIDEWYCYAAPCTGTATASLCGSSYDTALAVFDSCGMGIELACSDDLCDLQSEVSWSVTSGAVYFVRVSGFGGDSGGYSLALRCVSDPKCTVSSPAALTQIAARVDGPPGDLVSNRMLTVTAGAAGANQAIRVIAESLPPPFNVWNGTVLWATAPQQVCSLPGVKEPSGCGSAPLFDISRLRCDPAAAAFIDWPATTGGTINITHPVIIPGGQYTIQVLDQSCDAGDAGNFSAPLAVTNSIFGDITGGFDAGNGLWVATDGLVGIPTDILSLIAAFSNTPGNPTKLRADVEPCILDFKINIIDVVRALDGFRGLPFPFGPGVLDCPQEPCGG